VTNRTLPVVRALAAASAVIFAIVAIKEFDYASAHPHAYGPANNIAWGAVAGALLSFAVAILAHRLLGDLEARHSGAAGGATSGSGAPSTPPQEPRTGIRRYLTRKSIAIAAVAALVLFALSPSVQGYHVGRSESDTTCTTRFLVQFCNDEHARLAREQAKREAKEASEGQAAAERECHAIAKEAEEGKRRLNEGNYYLKCLRPGAEAHLLPKWKAEERREHEHEEAKRRHERERQEEQQRGEHEQQEAQRGREREKQEAQSQSHRAQLEREAAGLKAKAKSLTEEEEQLDKEGKFSQGGEKGSEAFHAKYDAEKKLREAKGE
jgi:hypothetical protein